MPKYWMINDRSQGGIGPDVNTDGMSYWVSDKQPLTDIKNWRQIAQANFKKLLVAVTARTASGCASCTTGHHVEAPWATSLTVRMRVFVLTI